MNHEFKDQVWKGQFKPTESSAEFEDKLRRAFGLTHRYDTARLLIGRSLAQPTAPDPVPSETIFYKNPLSGELLFGPEIDVWICALVLDGRLNLSSTVDDFRALVEAHWHRGYCLLRGELEQCENSETKLVSRLAELLPEGVESTVSPLPSGVSGEIRLCIGSVSQLHPSGKHVDFVINAPSVAPHIALMGAVGKGKTTTGVQMALELIGKARIPILFIDPKGEFVDDGARPVGAFAELGSAIEAVEVGSSALPLDFLPGPGSPTQTIAKAAMRFRDTLALCCQSPGDLQKDLLRKAVQDVITQGDDHSLEAINAAYQHALAANGKCPDSIVSRLNELTNIPCFAPELSPTRFFSKSWLISLKTLPEELKRLVTLLILDTVSASILEQSDSSVPGGFRTLRHLLVVDEARKVLQERRSQSLVDLVRQGRSKGSVVMLLSQDPSDFDGAADDFLGQIGTVVAFACAQNDRGLRSLAGVFGRKVQPNEFSDTYLAAGIAFVKLPGLEPDRIRCWEPKPNQTRQFSQLVGAIGS